MAVLAIASMPRQGVETSVGRILALLGCFLTALHADHQLHAKLNQLTHGFQVPVKFFHALLGSIHTQMETDVPLPLALSHGVKPLLYFAFHLTAV